MFKTIRLWWRVLRLTRLMLKSVHWHLKAVEDPEWLARFDRGELPFKPGDLLLDLTVTRDALELTLSVCEGLDAKTEARMESAKSHINEAIAALAEIL